MKLLIAAFSELRSADRERALNVLTATVAALETKISQLETAKEEQYKAAMANAIGSIVSGALSIGMTIIGSGLSIAGLRKKSGTDASFETKNATKGDIKNSDLLDGSDIKPDTSNISKTSSKTSDPLDDSDIKLNPQKADKSEITDAGDVTIQSTNKNESAHPAYSIIGDAFSRSAQGVGQITTGISGILSAIYSANKTEADIEVTKADALLEILKQAQEQYTKGTDSLQQFIDKVLNVMQQLLQSASQTERSIANI